METKVVEINPKERKEESKPKTHKTNNLNSKSSIKRYVSESVDHYSDAILSGDDKATICDTIEEYTIDYIKQEAKRLTFNSRCIKTNRMDKIKVQTNIADKLYAAGFVVTFLWCLFSGIF